MAVLLRAGTRVARALNRSYFGIRAKWFPTAKLRAIAELQAQQWLPAEELDAIQWKKIRKLLRHAWENVPFYREAFEAAGITPDDVRSPADYYKVPVLTREIVRDNMESLVDRKGKYRIRRNHTSGSSGTPISFYQDETYWDYGQASLYVGFRMCGYRWGDRHAFFWGRGPQGADGLARESDVLRLLRSNSLWLDSMEPSAGRFARWAGRLRRFDPEFLVGPPSVLAMLARFMLETNETSIRPRAIEVSGELLLEEQRRLIETAFGCEVFDRFGSREFANIAHECCEHTGLHVMAPHNFVEFVRDGRPVGPGELGHITVTNTNNYVMPFIRYQLADIGAAIAGQCTCGRGTALIQPVVGKEIATIVSPNGQIIFGGFFGKLFYKYESVRQFQVVQETLRRLRVKLVLDSDYPFELLARVESEIHHHTEGQFDIQMEICDRIPPLPSGKLSHTISHVPLPAGALSGTPDYTEPGVSTRKQGDIL